MDRIGGWGRICSAMPSVHVGSSALYAGQFSVDGHVFDEIYVSSVGGYGRRPVAVCGLSIERR